MYKRLIIVLFAVLTTLSSQGQLLYRITGKGLPKPSYIMGTYHLAPSSFVDSIPGLRATVDKVEQVCGELDMKQVKEPENVMKMTQAMMMPEGQTLQTLLSKEELDRLNVLLKELMGVDFTNPMVAGQLGKLTPSALSTQLTLLTYMKFHPDFNVADGIDDYMQTLGAEKGKAIIGFETVDTQVKALFQSSSLERQKELLLCFVDNKDYQSQIAQELIAAYFSQDMKQLESVLDEKLGNSCDSTDEEENVMIYNRNANWASQMPEIMAAKTTLFVVGAAHLIGEKGVLTLLRNAGYQVDGVK